MGNFFLFFGTFLIYALFIYILYQEINYISINIKLISESNGGNTQEFGEGRAG
jgi:hypothetical protein